MIERTNQRKDHLFKWQFDISVKWLFLIIIVGLVNLGVLWQQFQELNANVKELKTALLDNSSIAQALLIKDAQQDADILELKRRMNGRDLREK